MLPSTVLAIGYFYNFVQPVCDYLGSGNDIEVKGKRYKSAKMTIIIPKNLDSDIKKRACSFFRKKEFEPLEIPSSGRSYPLYVAISNEKDDTLLLNDMPTTLNGADKAIEMYLRKGHVGKSTEQQLLEDRELRNFEIVLRNLIKTDAYCNEFIEIETEI